MDLLSVEEAAGVLRCSKQTVYRAVYEKRIKWFRVREGGSIKVPYFALEGLIAPHLLHAIETASTAAEEKR